jgi:hypothetical protein
MPPSQLLTALENVWKSLVDFPDKATAGRLIDLADIRELLAVNGEVLDFGLLLLRQPQSDGCQQPIEIRAILEYNKWTSGRKTCTAQPNSVPSWGPLENRKD